MMHLSLSLSLLPQSAVAGNTPCLACPVGLTTPEEGAVALSQCSECEVGYCEHDRPCRVVVASTTASSSTDDGLSDVYQSVCDCGPWYNGDRCQQEVWLVVLLSTLGSVLAVLVVAGLVLSARQQLRKTKQYSDLQTKLLMESEQELEQLTKVWEIPFSDVQLIKRIDLACTGSFSAVWLGRWQEHNVAVKMILEGMDVDVYSDDDFEREFKFMRSLRHRNIVFFFGAGRHAQHRFLVTEYCERGALMSLLLDSRFEIAKYHPHPSINNSFPKHQKHDLDLATEDKVSSGCGRGHGLSALAQRISPRPQVWQSARHQGMDRQGC